jgi:hypothetical protein
MMKVVPSLRLNFMIASSEETSLGGRTAVVPISSMATVREVMLPTTFGRGGDFDVALCFFGVVFLDLDAVDTV